MAGWRTKPRPSLARNTDWHAKYTLPSLMDFYEPSRLDHGSFWYNWTTANEVAWKKFYRVWMQFLNDYKNRGGKVTVGSDSGFIYQTFRFGTILKLLQEACIHSLEEFGPRPCMAGGSVQVHGKSK